MFILCGFSTHSSNNSSASPLLFGKWLSYCLWFSFLTGVLWAIMKKEIALTSWNGTALRTQGSLICTWSCYLRNIINYTISSRPKLHLNYIPEHTLLLLAGKTGAKLSPEREQREEKPSELNLNCVYIEMHEGEVRNRGRGESWECFQGNLLWNERRLWHSIL